MMKKWKGALIDMDGVLYDTMKYHTLAWQKMMAAQNVACSREEFYLYEGMTGIATIQLLFQRELGITPSPEECRRLYEIKTRNFVEMGVKEIMPGAPEMVASFTAAGIPTVLVTGSGQGSLLDALAVDYPGAFPMERRVTAHDVRHGKPSPEPYLMGAEKLGVAPEDCIVVENAPLGVKAGKAAGCFTVAVTTGPIPAEELKKAGADLIFPDMPSFTLYLKEILNKFSNIH